MFQIESVRLLAYSLSYWLAQLELDDPVETPAQASVIFSGPQFFVALIAGLVLAFAFQLLLTNLSVAAGISYLGHKSNDDDNDNEGGSFGGTIRKISTGVGIWTLVTVTIALFLACLLAVQLSLLTLNIGLGAILGLVIWGAYFTLLVWVSSSTVGSLIGSVLNTATSGFQAILGTATAALGAKAASNQVVSAAEAAAAAVSRQIGNAIDPGSIRENLEDYLGGLRPPQLDLQGVRSEFEKLLNNPDLKALGPENLRHIDRQTFVDLVSNNTVLSKREMNQLVDTLEEAWHQVANRVKQGDVMGELLNYLRSARAQELRSPELNSKLDQLIAQMRASHQANQSQAQKTPGLMDQAKQMAMTAVTGALLGRTDLSDLDIQSILNRLGEVKDQVASGADRVTHQVREQLPGQAPNTIRMDAENYLMNTYPWHFNRETIKQEFREVIYDPQADPGMVRRQLEQIHRSDFVNWLQSRGTFTQDRIREIADQLEEIRLDVLHTVEYTDKEETSQELRQQVENYLRNTPKQDLTSEEIQRDFAPILEDSNASYEQLRDRFSQFDRNSLVAILASRPDMTQQEAETIIDRVQDSWYNVVHSPQAVADKAKQQYDQITTAIADYLRNTGKNELNPEGITRDLNTLFRNPKQGAMALQYRLSQVDRDTLVKLLSQRQDLSEEEVNQVIDRVEDTIYNIIRAPRRLAKRTQATVQNFQSTLEDYLRNTGKDALNPEGIKRDLSLLLHDPRVGMESLGDRLAQIDRETVISLLSQRSDISEAEATRIVDRVLAVRDSLVEQVRSIQRRIQDVIDGIFNSIRHYLNSLDRPELNYDGIKRDVRKLFDDPQAGFDALRYRLTQFNRDTLVAIMSSREDISEADANRIIDQIEGARNAVLQRAERIQQEAQRRLEDVKLQAARQAEETRKAAETAAWWLFGTALTSALFSALAGAIAVVW